MNEAKYRLLFIMVIMRMAHDKTKFFLVALISGMLVLSGGYGVPVFADDTSSASGQTSTTQTTPPSNTNTSTQGWQPPQSDNSWQPPQIGPGFIEPGSSQQNQNPNGPQPNQPPQGNNQNGAQNPGQNPMNSTGSMLSPCAPDQHPSQANPCLLNNGFGFSSGRGMTQGQTGMNRQGSNGQQNSNQQNEQNLPPCPIDQPPSSPCRPPSDQEMEKMQQQFSQDQQKRQQAWQKQMDTQRFQEMKSHSSDLSSTVDSMKAQLVPLKNLCGVYSDAQGSFYPAELDDMVQSAQTALAAVQAAQNATDLQTAMNSFMLLNSNNTKWNGSKITELYHFCENYGNAKETEYRMLDASDSENSLAAQLKSDGDTKGAQDALSNASQLAVKAVTLDNLFQKINAKYRASGAAAADIIINIEFFGQLKNNPLYSPLIPVFNNQQWNNFSINNAFQFSNGSQPMMQQNGQEPMQQEQTNPEQTNKAPVSPPTNPPSPSTNTTPPSQNNQSNNQSSQNEFDKPVQDYLNSHGGIEPPLITPYYNLPSGIF